MKLFILILFFTLPVMAQNVLPDKIDDFTAHKNWWEYHKDGLVAQDPYSVINGDGFLKITLRNPKDHLECNVGISERRSIYSKKVKRLTFETRVKITNPMLGGSRGWGFWKAAKGGKADNVAWFMEQLYSGNKKATWNRLGTIHNKKRDLFNYNTKVGSWHIYKVVRDIYQRKTEYFVDGNHVHTSNGIAPSGDMGFHLWVDNQMYGRGFGIKRAAWKGESALIVDYVRITTADVPQHFIARSSALKFYSNPKQFGNGKTEQTLLSEKADLETGEAVLITSGVLEKESKWDKADKLHIQLKAQNGTLYLDEKLSERSGNSQNNFARIHVFKAQKSAINLQINASNTPFLEDVILLNSATGKLLYKYENQPNSTLQNTITFKSNGKPVLIYLSGMANESPGWNHLQPVKKSEQSDDNLQLELNGQQEGWDTIRSLDGNSQFGQNRTVLLRKNLPAGEHTLKLIRKNKPHVNALVIYQE